ncbi:MAG TPA: radical SAM protein [Tepidisphaeraceae bacterium]|nr:radical SAM protein [Tepidisphaeraceae bacterium]
MPTQKKLLLVFPPLTMPTSPPLGSAMLKGFVERELPEWRVKILDLNLWMFDRLFQLLEAGALPLDAKTFPEGEAARIDLLEAARAFRGRGGADAFYRRPDVYDRYGDLFLRLTDMFAQGFARYCDSHDDQKPLPPLLQEMFDRILAEQADCVGFSMIFTEQLPLGALFGKLLRKRHGVKVLMGGSCFADTAEHFLRWYPESSDVIVAGEGEDALKELLCSLDSPERVPGAVFLRDGAVQKIPGSFRDNLDFFGRPDFSDLNLRDYYSPEPVIPVLLSRGCYWRRCTFCVHYRSAGLSYRMHSKQFVIEMLKDFAAKGIRNFAFIDEMIAPKHFEWLAKAIKEANLDIAYYALSKPVRYFTPQILSLMAESGCKYMLWGLESGNQRVLDLMDKGTVVADVALTLRRSAAAGIRNHVFLICGFPTESEEEFQDTLRILDENRDCIDAIHRGTFTLERKSPIFDSPERYGITRVWLKKDDPCGGRWGYETATGMSASRAWEVFVAALPFFRAFNPYARTLANFRDHAMLVYERSKAELKPHSRKFPKVHYRPAAPPTPAPVALPVMPTTTGDTAATCCSSHEIEEPASVSTHEIEEPAPESV